MRLKRMIGCLLSLVLVLGICDISLISGGSVASANGAPITVEQWKVAEIELASSVVYDNPFLDVEVAATFTGPNGEVIVRPGFWDGDDQWKVRFAPTVVGTWNYRITSSDPTNAGLQEDGVLTAVAYSGDKEIYQRGFLNVSDDGSHLTYADGTPFFWLGDTHWFFAGDESWDTSNKPGTTSQFKSMVDKRAEQKFTVYQSVIFSPHEAYWETGMLGSQINPDYFKDEIDRKMEYVAESGLVNAFGVGFHSNIDGFVEGSERLAAYVVARYGAYPVIWMTSGEGAGYDIGPREARIDGWRSVAKEINRQDGYNHPQTAHSTALTEKDSLGLPQFYEGEGWFDFHMLQGGHQKIVPTGDYDYYYSQYGIPFLESEANYEQIFSGWATDTIVRQTAYRSIQAGGMGYGYGAHGIWNASWDDSATGADYGYGHRNWYDAIDFVGADQMTYMIDFYRSLPWELMKYRPTGWADWTGDFTEEITDPVVRADDQANVLTVYFNAGTSSKGTISQLDNQAEYESRWFNPRAGADTVIEAAFTPTDGTWTVPEKPDGQDWLLLVKKKTPTPEVSAVQVIETLVSQGKSSSASSINQGTLVPSDAAFDGDDDTFWTASDGQFPQSLQVDLGRTYELSKIEQNFLQPNDWNYVIEGSVDGHVWSSLIDRSGAAVHGAEFTERVSGSARYVRLTITGSSNDWASSREFKVFAKINSAASIRSTPYLVDDREQIISKVPVGTPIEDFSDNIVLSVNGSLQLLQADGLTEVTQDGIGNGMIAAVTSEDGLNTRHYTIQTIANKGINLARTATVNVSSVENENYSAANINDGNNDTLTWSGWSANKFPAWVELDFGSDKSFNRVDLFTKKDYEQKEYTMQYWDGAFWVDLFPTVTDNTADHRAHLFEPVTSSKLRVWMTRGNVQQDRDPTEEDGGEKVARINELEVYLSPDDKLIEQLAVQGAGGLDAITADGGTLQMMAAAQPVDASDLTVDWSVTGTNDLPTNLATISKSGLLTAKKNGTVKVTAAAKDGSAVAASKLITITGQDDSVPQTELLSLGKPAQASSTNGQAATDAVDGSESTAWIAEDGTFPQWIMVDLEQAYQIDRVEQLFFNDDQWKYRVEGSLDGSSWTEWVDRTDNQESVTSFVYDVNQTARYVRLTITGAKDEWPNWSSSKEFSIYGKNTGESTPPVDPIDSEDGSGNGNNDGEVTDDAPNDNGGDNGNGTSGGNDPNNTSQTSPAWSDGTGEKPEIALDSSDQDAGQYRLDAQLLEQGFARAKPSVGGKVVIGIELEAVEGATAYALELPAASLRDVNADRQLEIGSPLGTLIIPANLITDSEWGAAERVEVSLSVEEGYVSVQWTIDGQPVQLHRSVKLALPAASIAEEAEPYQVVIRRIDTNGHVDILPLSRYDAATGAVWLIENDSYAYQVDVVNRMFNDLGNRSWMLEPIHALAARDLLHGVNDSGDFEPDGQVSRADFLIMLMGIIGSQSGETGDFADVMPGAYYYEAIRAARSLGIANGDRYNKFNPDDPITRQDMMALTARLLGIEEFAQALPPEGDTRLQSYKDASDISPYATQDAARLVALGLIVGDGEKLRPRGSLTRAEAATVVYKVLTMLEKRLLP